MHIVAKLLIVNMIYIISNRPGNGSFLPNQYATDDVPAQPNPAYLTQEDIHTYDYIPADGMILAIVDQCCSELPPELPPARKVQEQDPNNESKGWFYASTISFVRKLSLPVWI